VDTISIATADFNALVDAGGFTVSLLPSPAVTASECSSGDMWITIDYPGIAPDGDCNANGVLDVREIGETPALDLNRDARIDGCQIADDPSLDCNGNGRIDAFDIASGETDDNGNDRIDLCEYAKGDFDLSGEVDSADLSIILLYFGEFDPVFGDLDGDGEISGGDIASLLVLFGPVTW
jgi:hypothetical protein